MRNIANLQVGHFLCSLTEKTYNLLIPKLDFFPKLEDS
jgi:hypothetical protein